MEGREGRKDKGESHRKVRYDRLGHLTDTSGQYYDIKMATRSLGNKNLSAPL